MEKIRIDMGKEIIEVLCADWRITNWLKGDGTKGTTVELCGQLLNVTGRDADGALFGPPAGALAWQWNTPIEDARWLYDEGEIRDVEREDPSLIVRVHRVRVWNISYQGDDCDTADGNTAEEAIENAIRHANEAGADWDQDPGHYSASLAP